MKDFDDGAAGSTAFEDDDEGDPAGRVRRCWRGGDSRWRGSDQISRRHPRSTCAGREHEAWLGMPARVTAMVCNCGDRVTSARAGGGPHVAANPIGRCRHSPRRGTREPRPVVRHDDGWHPHQRGPRAPWPVAPAR